MKVRDHLKLSALMSVPASYVTDPVTGVVGCLAGGVLIDSDHLLDYFLNYRLQNVSKVFLNSMMLKTLLTKGHLSGQGRGRPEKRRPGLPLRSFLVLHSYELWIFIFLLGLNGNVFLLIVFLSGTIHIVSDFLAWRLPWYSFFFSYRLSKGFVRDKIQKIKEQLVDIGVDIHVCQDCGIKGLNEVHYEPVGEYPIKGTIRNFMVLCPKCHDKRHGVA